MSLHQRFAYFDPNNGELVMKRSKISVLLLIFFIPFVIGCGNNSDSQNDNGKKLENALLWKVTKGGGDPSYLFGTLHIMKSDYLSTWNGVKEAYQQSDKVIVETIIDSSKLMQFGSMMRMKDHELSDYLDSAEFETVKNHISGKINYPISAVEKLKPIQILTMLTMKEYQAVSTPLSEGNGMVIDQYFGRNGKEMGKEVIQLEGFLEQGKILFEKKSNQEQTDMLISFIEKADMMKQNAKSLVKAYENQDLNKMKKLYKENQNVFQNMAFLLEKRNKDWVKKAKPVLKEGGAFMAVGALHLPLENGLINLLREEGFEVKAVDVK